MKPTQLSSYKIFFWLVIASFLTILLYSGAFYAPFTAAKALFFYWIVELALPFYLFLCLRYFGFGHLKNPVIYWISGFTGLSLIAGIAGIDFMQSFWGELDRMQGVYFALHLVVWIAYLMLIIKIEKPKISWFSNILVVLGVLASAQGIWQKLTGSQINVADFGNRSSSVFGNPVFFAAFLVIPIFLSIYRATQDTTKKWWYLGASFLMVLGVGSTVTAGAGVGIAAGLGLGILVYFFDRQQLKRWGMIVVGMIILVGASSFIIAKVPSLREQFQGQSAQSRLIEWQIAWQGFKEKPILGVGPENFSYISNKYFDNRIYQYTSNGLFDKPHNYLLEVLSTRGILGLIAYLGLILMSIMGFWRLYRANQISKLGVATLISGFAAYIIQNLFAFDTISSSLTFGFLLALASAGWTIETRPSWKPYYSNFAAGLGAILFLVLFIPNTSLARIDLRLGSALKQETSSPPGSANIFSQLKTDSGFGTKPNVALEDSNFVGALTALVNTNPQITIGFLQEQTQNAIDLNEQVVSRSPLNYLENLISLARLYLIKSEIAGVLDPKVSQIVDQVNTLTPKRIEGDLILADAYNFSGDFGQAKIVLTRLLQKAPTSLDVLWEQVYIEAIGKNYDQALTYIQNILHQTGLDQNAEAQLEKLAQYYMNNNNYVQASNLFNRIHTLYPDNIQIYLDLANVYKQAGDLTDAQKVIADLQEQHPDEAKKYQSQINQLLNAQ